MEALLKTTKENATNYARGGNHPHLIVRGLKSSVIAICSPLLRQFFKIFELFYTVDQVIIGRVYYGCMQGKLLQWSPPVLIGWVHIIMNENDRIEINYEPMAGLLKVETILCEHICLRFSWLPTNAWNETLRCLSTSLPSWRPPFIHPHICVHVSIKILLRTIFT